MFVFLQVLLFCFIIYDRKHRLCFESLYRFLFGIQYKCVLAQISTDPLSWLRDLPHWSLSALLNISNDTVTISAVSLTLSHTSLSTRLHLQCIFPGLCHTSLALNTLSDLKSPTVLSVESPSKGDRSPFLVGFSLHIISIDFL